MKTKQDEDPIARELRTAARLLRQGGALTVLHEPMRLAGLFLVAAEALEDIGGRLRDAEAEIRRSVSAHDEETPPPPRPRRGRPKKPDPAAPEPVPEPTP